MLLIVAFHIYLHAIGPQLTDGGSIARMNNGYFCHPVFYKRLLVMDVLRPLGMIGNDIFIMISGFFMAGRDHIDLAKISKKLLLELGSASVFLSIVSFLYADFGHDSRYFRYEGISVFNNSWWFIGYYFVVILSAALFLNKWLSTLDRRKYTAFLLILFAFVEFQWSGILADNLAAGLRTVLLGLFLFSLGGYISQYNPFEKVRLWAIFLIIGIIFALVLMAGYVNTRNAIEDYTRNGSQGDYIQSVMGYSIYEINAVIDAVCIFEIFRRIRIPSNKVINFLGKATFMVYMIHENGLFQGFYNDVDWMKLLADHKAGFTLRLLLWIFIAFAAGTAVYSLYLLIGVIWKKSRKAFIRL